MRIRCRTQKGVLTLGEHLDRTTATIADLKAEIAAATGTPPGCISIRKGFPPRLVAPASDTATLAECGISDGEQLVLELSNQPSQPKPSLESQPKGLATAAPALAQAPPKQQPRSSSTSGVSFSDGVLVVREMKDDNSCLFRSIGYLFERSPEATSKLRKIVADAILSDPSTYSEAILGRAPKAYTEWIQKPDSWGGAIELSIFSNHFKTEIDSIDIATGRMDRFGEGMYENRVFVFYSGIHYDAIALSPTEGAPADFDQTLFSGGSAERAVSAAHELAGNWRKQHKFTDLATFTLRCQICSKGIVGQKDAQAHAMETGHASFGEYASY